jgi:dTDP-4-amino-4,6-dideoxygalactose transaminase
MNIPLVDLRKQYQPLKEEIISGMQQTLEGMQLFLGENVQAFEKEFAQFCGVRHGIGVSDGTTALHIILRAMGIGPGDEVITVAHTFIATAEAIVLSGARPVFVDIDPTTYLMDVTKIEAKLTRCTKAILPVHLYGQTVDMDSIWGIARRHGLRVIEDACQAHGALYRGCRAGSLGDAAAFSFYFSKNLGAYGEGGFIATDDDELAHKMRMIRDHGSERRYYSDLIGMNGRLDELQAVVLRAKLPHLERWNEQRREHAACYNDLLRDLPVITPVECTKNKHVYHLYVIRVSGRDELCAYLRSQGIATGIHYPAPIHMQRAMGTLGYKVGDLPATERVCSDILSLPMYPELTEREIEYIATNVATFSAGHADKIWHPWRVHSEFGHDERFALDGGSHRH